MSPAELAKSNSEHAQQRALFAWANMAARYGFAAAWDERSYKEAGYAERKARELKCNIAPSLLRMFAIPNGGLRDKATAGKLKAEGVKKGVPDVMLPVPVAKFAGLFIEMKRPKTSTQRQGDTSGDQDEWIGYLRRAGYAVAVAFDWQSAAKQIEDYIEQFVGSWS